MAQPPCHDPLLVGLAAPKFECRENPRQDRGSLHSFSAKDMRYFELQRGEPTAGANKGAAPN